MTASDRMATWLASLGSSQDERDDAALRPGHAPLDDRSPVQMLQAAQALARLLRFYADDDNAASGDWSPFLPGGDAAALQALLDHDDGRLQPHHALLAAFVQISRHGQAQLNDFGARHLQHQYRQVLGFANRPATPDRAHLVLKLKKGAALVQLDASHAFSAGKDALKVDQSFVPVRPVVLGHAQVQALAVVARAGQALFFAPEAASVAAAMAAAAAAASEAAGAADAAKSAPGWPPFTATGRPAAPVGFALASPLLRLAEGRRGVTIHLRFAAGRQARHEDLPSALQAFASGPEGWLGPFDVSGKWAGDQCSLQLQLPASQAAVVDHDPAVHQQSFPAGLPVIQLLLRTGAALGYADLQPLRLRSVQIVVQADGLRQLVVENDDGSLDAKKAFLAFGSQPVKGSRLFIGCEEALGKRLTRLRLHLRWHGAPADLGGWYAGYTQRSTVADGIRATMAWAGAGGSGSSGASSAPLVVLPADGAPVILNPSTAGAGGNAGSGPYLQRASESLQQLLTGGNALTAAMAQRQVMALPHQRASVVNLLNQRASALNFMNQRAGSVSAPNTRNIRASALTEPQRRSGVRPAPTSARAGFITLTLQQSLLHADYPRDAVTRALDTRSPGGLNPPYTPKVEQLTLDYTAESTVCVLDDGSAQAFQTSDVQLHHVDAFGSRREHAWLHSLRPWSGEAGAALLPQHRAAGELLIGLAPAQAGDAFSLHFQVAEGSADPQALPQPLQWSVLAGDAWHPLGAAEGLLDTSQHLRRSGIVAGVLPAATSTDHSLMPAGSVWLRACIPAQPEAACQLLAVHANAAEVVFVDQHNDPARLAQPLPAGSITKLATPLGAIKAVEQPYASFGGALAEGDEALSRRAAERLRHRDRAITAWDFERLVLQEFPSVWRAKCIPHGNGEDWQAAGQVTVVVVPRMQGLQAADPVTALTPRVDLATLEAIRMHLQSRCAPQARVHVRNPRYEPLQLQFKLRLRPGLPFSFHRQLLNEALLRQLSPWAFDVTTEPGFNGRVVRSALLDFVESQPGVDFVTDFALFRAGQPEDLSEVWTQAPDAILVSAAEHLITELPA